MSKGVAPSKKHGSKIDRCYFFVAFLHMFFLLTGSVFLLKI